MLPFVTGVFILSSLFAGCSTPGEKVEEKREKVEEAKQDLNKAEEDYASDMEQFRTETDSAIARNQREIDELNKNTAKEKKEAREEYRKRIAELDQRNKNMKLKMEEYKGEGKEKWESFKREFKHDMDELGQALRDLGRKNVK